MKERASFQGKALEALSAASKRGFLWHHLLQPYKLIILVYAAEFRWGSLQIPQITDFILDRKYTNYFQLQQAVSELVEADLSIKKRTVHTDEAIGLFGQYGMYDKKNCSVTAVYPSKPLQHQ